MHTPLLFKHTASAYWAWFHLKSLFLSLLDSDRAHKEWLSTSDYFVRRTKRSDGIRQAYTDISRFRYSRINARIFVYMSVCMSVFIFICIYACTYVCMYMCARIYVCMHVCMYVCISVWLAVFMHVCMHACRAGHGAVWRGAVRKF